MKEINILSLSNTIADLSKETVNDYLKGFGTSMSNSELEDLRSLVCELHDISKNHELYTDFFVSYSIQQISKEFDLLRFGEVVVVNIELKKTADAEKIKKQLVRNRYYLSFLNKTIVNFTFVANDKMLYMLKEDEIEEVGLDTLIYYLEQQQIVKIPDIDKIFNPTNYLVSPFNSTEMFIEGKYFLTSQQEEIKNSVLNITCDNKTEFISIYGAAGTGKTLLTYDIAKTCVEEGLKVIIFHCGNLNVGQQLLKENHSWSIYPIKSINHFIDADYLIDYDLIIFDEVQRVRKQQLISAIATFIEAEVKCIFSYDSNQCLATWEINRNIPLFLTSEYNPMMFRLTEKIRTNKEIASFIKCLFDRTKKHNSKRFENVEVTYFSDIESAQRQMIVLKIQGWKIINYTTSQYDKEPFHDYRLVNESSAHYVVGQEYDKVVATIDRNFCYNSDGKLIYAAKTYYHPSKMLFQILTRTRKKLHLLIIGNEEMLNHCLRILSST